MEKKHQENAGNTLEYGPHAETALGPEAFEYLQILDAVLDPYEHLIRDGKLKPTEVTLALEGLGLFDDLRVVEDIAAAVTRHFQGTVQKTSGRYGLERAKKRAAEGVQAALAPKGYHERPLRTAFIGEFIATMNVQAFLEDLRGIEKELPSHPEQKLVDLGTPHLTVRPFFLLSSWLRHYNGRTPLMEKVEIPEGILEKWREVSENAIAELRNYALVEGILIHDMDPALGLERLELDPPVAGCPFQWARATLVVKTYFSRENLRIQLGLSAITGDLGLLGVEGYFNLKPIFDYHQLGDLYEYLRLNILSLIKDDLPVNPSRYRRYSNPDRVEHADEALEAEVDDGGKEGDDTKSVLLEARAEEREAVAEVLPQVIEPADQLEKTDSYKYSNHFRGVNLDRALEAFKRLGFPYFNGTKHVRFFGKVDGKHRTGTITINIGPQGLHISIVALLKKFGLSRRQFWEKY